MLREGGGCGIEEGADDRRNAIWGPVGKSLLKYEVGCTKRGGGRWSLEHNVGAGVDEGASAALSVRVVARKQQGVRG